MFLMEFLQEGLKRVQVRWNSSWKDTVVLKVFFYEEVKIDFWEVSFLQFLSPCVPECGDVSRDCFFDVGEGMKGVNLNSGSWRWF